MFRINYLIWFLILPVFFILFNIDSLWTDSIDVAQHYALAYRISEQWWSLTYPDTIPSDMSGQWWLTTGYVFPDPTLAEMIFYPRGGHIIAAIIGTVFNSTFIGIQITILASIAVIWLSILVILNNMPRQIARVALLLFFMLFLINAFIFHFDVHGDEALGHFFYSQLVAHAFLYLSLIFSMHVEKKHGALLAAVSLVPIMLFIAIIHLMPAVQILGLIGGITAIKIFTTYKNREDFSKLKIIVAAIIPIASTIGLVFHPSFSAMRTIATHNGSLDLHNIPYPVGIITLGILVLITSFVLFVQWARRKDNIIEAKYLAIYGAATSAICVLQYALTYYDIGSDYAVKKYGFSLLTIMLIQLSMLVPVMTIKSDNSNETNSIASDSNLTGKIILYVCGLIILLLVFPNKKGHPHFDASNQSHLLVDVSNIVELEKKITDLSYNEIPQPPTGKSNVVIGLEDAPNGIHYAIDFLLSIAIAKTPRNLALYDVYLTGELSDVNKYYKIISSSDNPIYGSSGSCASSVSGNISIIDSLCLKHRIESSKLCKNSLDFAKEFIFSSSLQGFSFREEHGRWTNGRTARFMCLTSDNRYNSVELEMAPFIFGLLKSQRLKVSVNGIQIYEDSISIERDSNNPIIIDLTNIPVSDEYAIEFDMPDATSPKEVGLNQDDRELGFSIRRITFH